MKKISGIALAFIAVVFILSSCKSDTYADKVRKEKKAIEKFISDNGIKVTNTYPEKRAFGEKEYFRFRSGETDVYIHVIDSGKGEKAVASTPSITGTTVYMRFEKVSSIGNTNVVNATNIHQLEPMKLIYGSPSTYVSGASGTIENIFLSTACAIPLQYVRNGAAVSLIVPFKSGSAWQNNAYETLHYGKMTYKFD